MPGTARHGDDLEGVMRRFEFRDEASSKFWEISRDGASFTVTFGRIGARGQTQTKAFPAEAKAQAEADKLVAEKVKKGYVEVTAAGVVAATATAAPALPAKAMTAATATAAPPAAKLAPAPPAVPPPAKLAAPAPAARPAAPPPAKPVGPPAATQGAEAGAGVGATPAAPRVVWTGAAKKKAYARRSAGRK